MLSLLAVAIVGLLLGLLGGGGSLLILPILVYMVGLEPVAATSYSLLIVGVAALFGAINYWRQGLVSLPSVVSFGLPSVAGVFFIRLAIMPHMPAVLLSEPIVITKNGFVMTIFAVIVFGSSYSMIHGRRSESSSHGKASTVMSILAGALVGLVTGFVGAGGGFLIVPALLLLLKLPMREAVATSLFVIALKSILGFLGDVLVVEGIQWWLLVKMIAAAVIGIGIGVKLNRRVAADRLKAAFGWFVLAIGVLILVGEFFPGK